MLLKFPICANTSVACSHVAPLIATFPKLPDTFRAFGFFLLVTAKSDSKDSHWSVEQLSSHTQPGWDIRETIHAGKAFAGAAYEHMDHTWGYEGLSLKCDKSLLWFVIHCSVDTLNTTHDEDWRSTSVCLHESLSVSLSPHSGQPQQSRTKSDQKIKSRYTYNNIYKHLHQSIIS